MYLLGNIQKKCGIYNLSEMGNSAQIVYIEEQNRLYYVDVGLDNDFSVKYYDTSKVNMKEPWKAEANKLKITWLDQKIVDIFW